MRRMAVVVVNFNAGALLRRCLESLVRQSLAPQRIIVVDNNSSDGSQRCTGEFAAVELISLNANLGFAAASNRAMHAASDCDWIAMLNPDAYAALDWLEALDAAVSEFPQYASFASRMLGDPDMTRLDGAGDNYHVSGLAWRRLHGMPDDAIARTGCDVFSACAGAALYKRSAFEAAGGFDERLFCYLEDVDLGFRMQLLGMQCRYVPQALVHHTGSAIAGKNSDFQIFQGHRNLVRVFVKNMPLTLLCVLLPLHLAINAMTVLYYLVRGRAGVILRAKYAALLDLPDAWRARRAVHDARRLSSRALWRKLDKSLVRVDYRRETAPPARAGN